jgi:hypothetical protein
LSEPGRPEADIDARRLRAVLLLGATLAFAVSPLVTGGFRGFAPDAFPVPQIDPPVQPAGWAFAIWGPIYAGLLAHAGWGLVRSSDAAGWDAPRPALIASLVLGAAWIPTAQANAGLATAMIWAMLLLAVAALARGAGMPWPARLPLGLYAGWLTAASWVSVGLALGGWGWLSGDAAALVALPLAVAFAAAVQLRRAPFAPEYGATVIWALCGILAANLGRGLLIPALALAGAAAMAAAIRLARARPAR